MLRAITAAILLAVQPPAERPSFEVASIKAYPPDAPFPPGRNGITLSPDGVAWRFTRLQNCIRWAYDIPGPVIGPNWITDRYDIAAKASGPVTKAQLRLMVQTLLEDRFQLKVHREMRDIPVVLLTVAKNGPKNLQPAEPVDPFQYTFSDGRLTLQGSMADFAAILGNSPPYGVREQVLDRTALAGSFAFSLDVKNFDVNDPAFGGKYQEMQSAAFVFVSAALEKKYGLKLEHKKVPLESLVVDSGNKTPSGN